MNGRTLKSSQLVLFKTKFPTSKNKQSEARQRKNNDSSVFDEIINRSRVLLRQLKLSQQGAKVIERVKVRIPVNTEARQIEKLF